MKTIFAWILTWLCAACLLTACGSPDEGPPLGDFPAITKKEGDESFTLTAPSSKSPAPMNFTSSNLAVATIDGTRVTIKGAGETTITAAQERIGSYGPTLKTTTLTVTAVPCESGSVRINGKCAVVPTCVIPAVLTNNQCVAPASSGITVHNGARIWRGVTHSDTWVNARDFCKGSVIDGVMGWRLPTAAELTELHTSGATAGRSWVLAPTWSDTTGTTTSTRSVVVVNLASGAREERSESAGAYVACVR